MNTGTAAPAIGFAGYWRQSKRHQWVRLTEADDFGEAWDELLGALDGRPRGEALVVRGDKDPNHEPVRR
jgi:hypothetical protein